MMKLILLLSIVSTFTSVGCKTSSSPTYTLSKEVYTDKINFGGFYGSCDSIDETCSCLNNESYVSHQLIFFENGKICEIIGRMNDSADVVLSYRDILNNDYNLYSWGTYQISDDKIKATINSLYFARGRRWKHFVTNYEGLFLSKNCITDWKAPPLSKYFS